MDSQEIYSLQLRVNFLNKRVLELENEIHKRDCLYKMGSVSKSDNKKQEIIQGLEYLKNKKEKTKQDKENIYTFEMILKNMR